MRAKEVNYHERIDFRALDVIVDAIDKASPIELYRALKTCAEMSGPDSIYTSARKRAIWKALWRIIRAQMSLDEWRRVRKQARNEE